MSRAVRIELITARVLYRASYRVPEYSEVAFNYRVVKSKRIICSAFKFVLQQWFEIVKIMPEMLHKSLSFTIVACKIRNRETKGIQISMYFFQIYYFFLNFRVLELKNKARSFSSWNYVSSSSTPHSPIYEYG